MRSVIIFLCCIISLSAHSSYDPSFDSTIIPCRLSKVFSNVTSPELPFRHTRFYEGVQHITDQDYSLDDVLDEERWRTEGRFNSLQAYNCQDTFWLRVLVINTEPTDETYLFYLQRWTSIDLYLPNQVGHYKVQHNGLRSNYHQKSFRDPNNYFKLDMAAGDSVIILARVHADLPSVTIPPEQSFFIAQVDEHDYKEKKISNARFLPFQGFLLAQAIYGVVIFFLIREKIVFYFFLLSLGNFLYDGFTYPQDSLLQLFPTLQVYQVILANLSVQLILIGAIFFVAEYVELGSLIKRSRKYLSYFLWFEVLWLILSAGMMIYNYEIVKWFNLSPQNDHRLFQFHTSIGLLLAAVAFALVFIIPFYGIFRKVKHTWLLTISTVFPALSAVAYNIVSIRDIVSNKVTLYELTFLDNGMSSSYAFVQFGEFVFILVFAIIVGLKAKGLYQERRMALEKQMEIEKRAAKELREVFAATDRFVPYEFIKSLGRKHITDVELGDHVEREVTVLFGDIRNYTGLSEAMTAEENFQFIRIFNGLMSPIIHQHKGFINQYLGDGIMALFPHEPTDALKAAIAMQQQLHQYNIQRLANGSTEINMGIGFHTGSLVMGIIGDAKRMDATTIADVVNTASRIESLTKYFGTSILLSEESHQRILSTNDQISEPGFQFRYHGLVQVKGKKKAIGLYECFDGDLPEIRNLKAESSAHFQSGVDHYYQKEFTMAKANIAKCLAIFPGDRSANHFYQKIVKVLEMGETETWTGIEQMESK